MNNNYNQVLTDGLAALQQDSGEKSGALKFLGYLKTAMSMASAVGVPFAGTASVIVGLADAGIEGLNGNPSNIDLDKLFVTSATDDLKSKGISEDDINSIANGSK